MPPKLYGWQHLTYLAIFASLLVALIVITKFFIKTDKAKTILIKSVAGVLLVCVLLNRVSIAFRFNDVFMFIPNSYCGVTSLVLSICVLALKPNSKAFHFLWYMGFVGGLATMLYPDFLGQHISFWYVPTISGLLHHSVLLTLCILMLQTKWFSPSLKNWWIFPVGMSVYTLYGLFLMDIFNWGDAMSINSSLIDGTPLNWWFILIVGTVLLVGVLYLAQLISSRKSKKLTANASQPSDNN